jgi:hypothetical protein
MQRLVGRDEQTEAKPGRLLGLAANGAERGKSGSGLLYGVDVVTGEVQFRKLLTSAVSTDDYWPHWVDLSYEYLDLARGPDGFIWTYLKNVLVRIDPTDASVHVVGKIDPVGHPTFIGNDMYLFRSGAVAAHQHCCAMSSSAIPAKSFSPFRHPSKT